MRYLCFFLIAMISFNACCAGGESFSRKWTFIVYLDGDNDLESQAIKDIAEMMRGVKNNPRLEVIVLVDLKTGTAGAQVFGENFSGTRLYRITNNGAERLSGRDVIPEINLEQEFEANMGDPIVLKEFINYCKNYYTADYYALVLWNHGSGTRSDVALAGEPFKAICQDITSGDIMYNAEITDVLGVAESVDVLIFDACLMGYAEIAYQYAPDGNDFSATYMAASPALLWGYGLDYNLIYESLYRNMRIADPLWLGNCIVDAQQYSTSSMSSQTYVLFDLNEVGRVKSAVDIFAAALAADGKKNEFCNIQHNSGIPVAMAYCAGTSDNWKNYAAFDLYDLARRVQLDSVNFSETTRSKAEDVMKCVDAMIINSFAYSDYPDFIQGVNGAGIFFPKGDVWDDQSWYNSIDTVAAGLPAYGKLRWCIDGATPSDGIVENWFEMLDSWFDAGSPGVNQYQP